MGRAAVGLVVLAAARGAAAAPAVSFGVEGSGGAVWAPKLHWLRDDEIAGVRLGLGLGPFAVLDVAVAEDLDRVEPAFGVGVRARPWAGDCWRRWWSPYVRAQAAIVGASHLSSNYDLTAGAGHWGGFGDHATWLHWYAELDVVARVGEYDSVSVRFDAGLAIATARFWK